MPYYLNNIIYLFIVIFIIIMFIVSTLAGFISLITVFLLLKALMNNLKRIDRKIINEKLMAVNKIVKTKMEELGFNITQRYDDEVHENRYKFIAIDEDDKKVALVENGNYRIFDYRDIVESQIIEDGQELTSISRTSQVGRALVGGVLAGRVGALIGGVSSKQRHTRVVEKVSLNVIVNDTKNPTFSLDLLPLNKNEKHVKKENEKYKQAINTAKKIHNLISVLIRQADQENQKSERNIVIPVDKTDFLADELEKLYSLVEKGIISQSEFDKQKIKLFNE